jgi:hypothetical protein
MLNQSWSNVVRTWISRVTKVSNASRSLLRRRVRPGSTLTVEHLESRLLLSAVSISDVSVLEGDAGTTNAVFTVTLSAPSAQTVTVVATTADGTATAPSDYTALPATILTFAPGETSKTISVAVNGDTTVEPNETFSVNLTGVINATVSDAQGIGTIINDDSAAPVLPPPTLSINDVTLLEGNTGTTNAVFTISLSAPSALPVTVIASSADNTATTPSDYLALPPTFVTFAPGTTTMTVSVPVVGDATVEPDETFFVNLSAPVNATLADDQGVGTILNDDPGAPVLPLSSISISDVSVLEGNVGTTNAVFTITLSAASALPVSVMASSADGTATTPSDYILLPPTLVTFAPGETTKTVAVLVNGDVVVEGNETFVVNLTTPVNATLSDDQALGTIIDDDAGVPVAPPPSLSITDVSVLEGNAGVTNAVFTVTLSAPSAQTVTVTATSADGTATTPADYVAVAPIVLTFLPGQTTQTVTVGINGDVLVEGDENFFVNLSAPVNATISDNQGVGTIIDDDPAAPALPTPSVSISDVAVLEGNVGTTNAVFTITLSAPSAQAVTVLASSADDTATSPSDYIALPPTLVTFAPGETSKTVTVLINGDTTQEPDEDFFVNLTAPINATISDAQGVGTIVNDDGVPPVLPPPNLSINDVTLLEGNVGTTNAVFTITLSAPSAQTVTVLASSADGTATTPSDYLLLPPTLVTFAPGETTKTVTVVVNGDAIVEPDETFVVNLSTPVNATLADDQGLGTILNDDPTAPVTTTPSISINDVAVVEGNVGTTNAVFTITLSAPSAQTVTVVASSTDGSATTPSDYILLPPTIVTFAPGETSKTVTVLVNGDVTVEPNETFAVNLTTPLNATLADNQGQGTIVDDDGGAPVLPPPTLSINDVSLVEGDLGVTNAVFTVTLSAPSALTVTAIANTADGTATSPLDYLQIPPTLLTFAPGVTTMTVTVPVNGDTMSEADETFFVNLSTPVNATFADNQGQGTIINDDTAPSLSIDDVSVVEGDVGVTNAVFTITLSAPSGQAVTVLASSADGTATSPSDYIQLPPTLVTFAPGQTTMTVTVPVNGDTLSEANETFFVNLTTPINATIADAQGLGTITNDDVAPTLSINDVTVVEGNVGVTNAVFTITLSAASGQAVTVLASSADGTATSPSDYIQLPPTLVTFAPGQTTMTVTVPVNGDTLSEPDETFFVNLTAPINATITDAQGLGTITNDDATPSLSINDVSVVEGNVGVTNAVFTITLSAPSGQAVTVLASSADGTATSPSDYIQLPPTLVTFAPGVTTMTVTVPVNGDTLSEADETFFVNLTTPINATITDAQGLGTITNDDVSPTLSINDVTVVEGNVGVTNAVFTITLSAASGQAVTVLASSADGTATSPSDYIQLPPTLVTFAPGVTTMTITVPVNGDTLSEPDETFFVNLTAPINASITDAQGLGTITNDDATPSLSINDVTVLEGNAGTTNAVFTITLSAASGQAVTVLASSADGTATTPSDYILLPPTLVTFAPGVTSMTVTVPVNGDTLSEANETFSVNLNTPINATIADNQGIGTIIDDDVAPTLSINDVTVVEGNAGTTNAVFTVTLSAASGQAVTVLASSADGTATTPSDYILLPPTLVTFAPGQTTMTVTVPVNGDTVSEADETFFVNLNTPTGATIADNQGIGTITNDDTAPTLSINDVTVLEGNAGTTNAVFTVTLSAASGQTVTVLASSADGTATSPSDYTVLPPTLVTFAPGETTKTITVAVNGDTVAENNETFFVNLNVPTNATIADNQAVGTITNDDIATVSIAKITDGAEANVPTNGLFRVTQSAISDTDTVVTYAVTGTATPGSDYTTLTGTVTIPAGQTTADINVAVLNDAIVEDTETVIVTETGFGAHSAGVVLGAPAGLSATVNITDDDGPFITSSATASAPENTPITTVVLDVNANPLPGHVITFGLSGPDAARFNINPATGEITFAASPDYEAPADQGADNVYNVTVTATADFTPTRSTSQDLTITVTPVNDVDPVFVDASPVFSLPENSPVGTVVGAVSATDGDLPAQTVTYSIVSGNEAGAFTINAATGQITVADSTPLNFETTPVFTLQVRATDSGSPTRTADAVVVVNLTNVAEGPFITIPHPDGIFHLGRIPAFVSPDSTFTYGDLATPDYSSAQLTASIVANRGRTDKLSIFPKGSGEGEINVKGHKVYFGGVQIGTFKGGHGNAHPDLVVSFNGNATTTAVDNLFRRLNFHVNNGVGITRTVHLQVTNIGGVDSNVATRDIAVVDIR